MGHAISQAYFFLAHHGLYEAIVTFVVGWTLGRLFGIRKAWRKILHHEEVIAQQQFVIADRLDTSTPGGLGDLMASQAVSRPVDRPFETEQSADRAPGACIALRKPE